MDIYITTSEPEVIDVEAIAEAIENLNLFVGRIFVNDDLRWDFAEQDEDEVELPRLTALMSEPSPFVKEKP